jgi:CPA1 family monovalent cation:H+ antiporter
MHDIGLIVFGLTGLLALTSLLPPLARRLRLPYSVLLALAGSVLGFLVLTGGNPGSMITTDFLRALSELSISSEAFIIIFLPVLLFETALVVDVRRLFEDWAPILLMAVVAVVVCTFVVGLALSRLSDFGLVACLLLGSIVATTDPAAVIGIFREIGAPKRLMTLVEGESLLNDAAAIALSSMLLGILISGEEAPWLAVVVRFVASFLGGALAGWVMGLIACAIFPMLRRVSHAEITLTVALAYLAFFIPEHYFHVSGVVSCVAAALTVSSLGRTQMSPHTYEHLEGVWGQLGFWANSLIFILAAMLVPRIMADITWVAVGLTAVVYVATLFARGIVVGGFLPLLSAVGIAARINNRMKGVLLWGGLRGAVSLALALAILEHPGAPGEIKQSIVSIVTGYVLLTLLINGSTLRLLIRWLRLDQLSASDRGLRDRALSLVIEEIEAELKAIARREILDPRAVETVIGRYGEQLGRMQRERGAGQDLKPDELLSIGLTILCAQEELRYFENFKSGIMPRSLAFRLLAEAVQFREAARSIGRIGYASTAQSTLAHEWRLRFAVRLNRWTGFDRWLAVALAERFETLLNRRLVIGELLTFSRERLAAIVGEEAASEIRQLVIQRLRQVDAAMTALRLQYPDYARDVQARYLGRIARQMEARHAADLAERAVISGEVAEALERDREERWADLDQQPRLDVELTAPQLIARVPLFASLDVSMRERIARLTRPRFVLPDEAIVRKGERGEAMYFIASGAVSVLLHGQNIELGSGQFFGELALLTGHPRNADVVALGYCRLLELKARDFQELLSRNEGLKAAIERSRRNVWAPTRARSDRWSTSPFWGLAAWTRDGGTAVGGRAPCFGLEPRRGKADALVAAGQGATSPADAARGSAAIFSMLSDDEASRAVWAGEAGALAGASKGALAIECSTLSGAHVAWLAARAHDRGLAYIDCPVTGLPEAAAEGTLTLLVGAQAGDLERARPLLAPVSATIRHFGPVGAGTAYKLIINLMGAVQIASLAEGLRATEGLGLDRETVIAAMEASAAASPQVKRHVRRMARRNFASDLAFTTALRHKDAAYAMALTQAAAIDMPLGRIATRAFALARASDADADEASVIDVLQDLKS